jgi:hypothetical protein
MLNPSVPERIVVYTAMFDDYDVVLEPREIESSLDYVCFTDSPGKIPGIWDTRKLSPDNISPKLKSGKVKTLPHHYFSDYNHSVWVDANCAITGKLKPFVSDILDDIDVAVPKHHSRNCIYKEAKVCMEKGLTQSEKTRELMDKYNEKGFPENYGLSETGVLVRNHQNPNVKEAMETWWSEYRTGPERDQLSFDYALWKTDLDYLHLPRGTAYKSKLFRRYRHKDDVDNKMLYEFLLRKRVNPRSYPEELLAKIFLSLYLGCLTARDASEVIQNQGLTQVLRAAYRRYIKRGKDATDRL